MEKKAFITTAKILSLCSFTIAVIAIIGWFFDISSFKSIISGFVEMKFNTALLFMLASISIYLKAINKLKSLDSIMDYFILIVSALTLFQYIFNINIGIDELFMKDVINPVNTIIPGRMAPTSAIAFIFLSCILFWRSTEKKVLGIISEVLVALILSYTLLVFVSYLYNSPTNAIEGYTPMALSTAIVFAVLSIAWMCLRREVGILSIVFVEGGRILSILVPSVIIIPIILGFLRIVTERNGLIPKEAGLSIHVSLNIVLLFIVVLIVSNSLKKNERQKQQLLKELREMKENAEKENFEKSNFLAKMSHEIRTPLNSIMGYTELSLDIFSSSEQREYLQKIKNSSSSLLYIINDILDLSKIENNKLELESIGFNPKLEFESVAESFEYKAEEKNVNFYVFIDPRLPDIIKGDSLRIKQILINLLSNSFKFTSRKGKIFFMIECNYVEEKVCDITFKVTDNGIGMSKEQLNNLFNPYEQASKSTAREYGGTGLGLSICKELIEKMGSKIEVSSTEAVGSTFSFVLRMPIICESTYSPDLLQGKIIGIYNDKNNADDQIKFLSYYMGSMGFQYEVFSNFNNRNKYDILFIIASLYEENKIIEMVKEYPMGDTQEKPYIIIVDKYKITLSNAINKIANPKIKFINTPLIPSKIFNSIVGVLSKDMVAEVNKKNIVAFDIISGREPVLVVDDNELNRELLGIILRKFGLTVEEARDGLEAYNKYKKGNYSIIFMDVNMPVMNGEKSILKIREYEKHSLQAQTPIVMLTAQAMKGDRERYMSCQIDDYLSKPVELKELKKVITKYFSKKDADKTDYERELIEVNHVLNENAQALGIDLETYLNLSEKLIIKMAEYIQKIKVAIENGDNEQVFKLSHNLKGVSANYRFQKIASISESLELAAKISAHEKYLAILESLENEYKNTKLMY